MAIFSNEKGSEIISETIDGILENVRRYNDLSNEIQSVENNYVNTCNKEISNWKEFKETDVIKELNYCLDYFVLMKEGDIIKCDCGTKEMELYFDGKKTIYKDGAGCLVEYNVPEKIKKHTPGCFGTCLLEEPSRHPGTNASGGNDCEPYIVGTSWLDTYNNAKAENLRLALNKQSWLACKYMGRIMSVDVIEEIDTAGMTEEDAFEMMLAWVRGEQYIPQVILDKITTIYAGQDIDYFNDFKYKGAEAYDNVDKYNVKIIAWSKFVNNLWETKEQKENHLEIRPVLLKAICMAETRLGEGESKKYNSEINIAQSMNTGDGELWHKAYFNPYPYTFAEEGKGVIQSNILAWGNVPGSNGDNVTNGYVQFRKDENDENDENDEIDNYFYENGERKFTISRENYFGKADVGEVGSPLFLESIKMVNTNGDYPVENKDGRTNKDEIVSGKIIMVVHNQQSVDMSLFAGALILANKSTSEKKASEDYNGNDPDYDDEVEGYLKDMGAEFEN